MPILSNILSSTMAWIPERLRQSCASLVFRMFHFAKVPFLNRPILKYFPEKYEIRYQYKDQKYYRINLNPKNKLLRRASPFKIENENGEDVISLVAEFMGPCRDFHGLNLTPKTMGFKKLTFFYILKDSRVFEEKDRICNF